MGWQEDILPAAPQPEAAASQPAWRGDLGTEQPPAATVSRPAPGLLDTDQVGRFVTFGLSDKATALGSATGAAVTGRSGFWDAYGKRLNELRGQSKAYTEAHPIAATIGPLAGGLIAAPAAGAAAIAAPTMGRAMGQSAMTGGAIGALGGLGQSDHSPVRDTALGAAGGAAFGAALPPLLSAARPAVEAAQRHLPAVFPGAVDAQATRRLGDAIRSDVAAGGPGVPEMSAALTATPRKPLGLVDVGGENVRGLSGQLARSPGEGRQVASEFFTTRDADAGARLLGDIDTHISAGGSAYDAVQQQIQQRAQTSAPLYQRAFETGKAVHSDRLQQFLDDPILQQGLSHGLEVQRLESLARGQRFTPNDYTIVFPESLDTPRFAPTPNMRTLDAAKRGLDSMLDQYRNPVTGALQLDQRGRAINEVRASFLKELDGLNPEYSAARQAFAGPSQSMDAIRQGQNFQSMRPEQIRDLTAKMGASDKDFFLMGVADKLRTDVQRTAISGDESKRVINNEYVQKQLRPLFGSEDAFKRFTDAVAAERTMFNTRTAVVGNSATAARLAQDQSGGSGIPGALTSLATGAAAAGSGEPFVGWPMILRGLRAGYQAINQPSAAVRDATANMVFSPDHIANLRRLAQITAQRPPVPVAPALVIPGSMAFGSLAPGYLNAGERGR